MRAILVLIVAAGAAVPAVAADKVAAVPKPTALEPAAEELVGAYKCVGDAGAGKEYHGSVEIDKVGDCYRIKWTIGARALHRPRNPRPQHALHRHPRRGQPEVHGSGRLPDRARR